MSLGRSDLLQHCSSSYRAAKDAADFFQTAKQILYRKFHASGCGTWVSKPPEEEVFTLSTSAPVIRKPLIPPGSAAVSGRSLQPVSSDTTDDSPLEDFT